MVEVAVVLLMCLLTPAGHRVHAAEAVSPAGSELLIEALADRTYERRTYTADDVLDGRATLRVGALQVEANGRLNVKISVERFSTSGERISERELQWTCNPDAAQMFMSLLLLPGVDEEGAEIRVDGPPLRYPDAPRPGDALVDVSLDIRVRSGMLALLGNRTRVKLHHRRIQPAEPPAAGRYIIDSEVDATVFLLGMPLKRRRFRSLETVQAGVGMMRQRMNFSDGSYAVIAPVDDNVTNTSVDLPVDR